MSADNGVYILYTDNMDFDGPSYRVVHAQGIDSIYGKFNEETCNWEPPVSIPDKIKSWVWDESVTNWVDLATVENSNNTIGVSE